MSANSDSPHEHTVLATLRVHPLLRTRDVAKQALPTVWPYGKVERVTLGAYSLLEHALNQCCPLAECSAVRSACFRCCVSTASAHKRNVGDTIRDVQKQGRQQRSKQSQ